LLHPYQVQSQWADWELLLLLLDLELLLELVLQPEPGHPGEMLQKT